MDYQKYLKNIKELYDILLCFIEQDGNDENYKQLIDILEKQQFLENKEDTLLIIHLLVQISNNHHRQPNFFKKITLILEYFLPIINQTFTNSQIFELFKSNKAIILFLIENKTIKVDKYIAKSIFYQSQETKTNYCHFFYLEIKKFLSTEERESIQQDIYDDNIKTFEQNRKIGENENYICELIRRDSIDEFIIYVNKNPIVLRNLLTPSIFETNSLLMKNEVSLIEYASFYGSIQIFNYLRFNGTELKPSLWIYAIHSNNAEMIHLLEQCNVKSPNLLCLKESIKCHHNEITNYFKNVFIDSFYVDYKSIFKYYNFDQIPNELNDKNIFFYLCSYDYSKLIELYLNPKKKQLSEGIIQFIVLMIFNIINVFFFYIIFFKLFFFYKNAIRKAAKLNDIEMIYILLTTSDIRDISNLFKDIKKLNQIAIPPCITEIGRNAFQGCIRLKQISLPSTCELIGQEAFESCNSLKKISIPSSVKRIENKSFANCMSLTKISLPSSLLSIGEESFSECRSLRQVSIPFNITKIKKHSFANCLGLNQVILPSSLTTIENYAFYNCSSLMIINIPSSVKSVGDQTFKYCYDLKDLCCNYDEYIDDYYNFIEPYIPGYDAFGVNYLFLFTFSLEFICAFIWLIRIYPWFKYGYNKGKKVYQSLKVVCVSYFSILITCLIYYLIRYILTSNFNVTKRQKKLIKKCIKRIKIVFFIVLLILEISMMISGIIASSYSLKNEKINGKSFKCLKYVFDGYQGAFDWASNQSLKKQMKLEQWHLKMIEKAYKKDGNASNYYCFGIGIPTMIFAGVPIYFIIMVLVFTFIHAIKVYPYKHRNKMNK